MGEEFHYVHILINFMNLPFVLHFDRLKFILSKSIPESNSHVPNEFLFQIQFCCNSSKNVTIYYLTKKKNPVQKYVHGENLPKKEHTRSICIPDLFSFLSSVMPDQFFH